MQAFPWADMDTRTDMDMGTDMGMDILMVKHFHGGNMRRKKDMRRALSFQQQQNP